MSNSSRFQRGIKDIWKQRELQAMVWPGLIWMAVFSYVPLVFLYIAFTDYRISTPLFENNFVGLKHFAAFLSDDRFWRSVYNTLGMSALRITLVVYAAFYLLGNFRRHPAYLAVPVRNY